MDAASRRPRFVVVGQMARDLVLCIEGDAASAAPAEVTERRELLGGKGANQAVGLTQLGGEAALVAVIGEDGPGRAVRSQAHEDGIDTCVVAQRGETALLVDIVGGSGDRRLVEHVPADSLLTPEDVRAASRHIRSADAVCVQLQQPADAVREAARLGRQAGALLAVDGGAEGGLRDELLPLADVVRADAVEAEQLVGFPVDGEDAADRAADRLMESGTAVVAVAVPEVGDLVAWADGRRLFRFGDAPVVDPTGAGDAFFAGLVTGLVRGWEPERAGELASRAAAATVSRPGGRPDLRELRPR